MDFDGGRRKWNMKSRMSDAASGMRSRVANVHMPKLNMRNRFSSMASSVKSAHGSRWVLYLLPIFLVLVTAILTCVFAFTLDNRLAPVPIRYWEIVLTLGLGVSAAVLVLVMPLARKPCAAVAESDFGSRSAPDVFSESQNDEDVATGDMDLPIGDDQ